MREMKDSGIAWIGKIPVDWKVCRVKFLADNNHLYPIGDGDHGMIKSSDYLDEGIPYIRVLNLTWCNGLNLDNLVFISEEMNRRIKNSELKPNDILVAKTGATIGKTAIVPISLPISNTTSHVGKISIAPIHSAKYFYYVMSSFIVQKQIRDISAMQSTRPELGIEGLKNLILIVPSYKEQKQISYFLDAKCAEIDVLSSDIQTQIDTLEQYKRSVISEAVTKGLNPNVPMKDSGIEWIGAIPVGWNVSKIKYIASFGPTCNFRGVLAEDKVAYAPMECVKQGCYEERDAVYQELPRSLTPFERGDIIMAKVTPCFENGNIAILDKLSYRVGLGSSELFVFRAKKIVAKYLFYWLQNHAFMERACATMTGAGGLKRVSSSFCKNCEIHLPPRPEQQAIVDYLDAKCAEIDQVIAQKQEQLATLAEYKKSLIYEYVTGKKEVPVS